MAKHVLDNITNWPTQRDGWEERIGNTKIQTLENEVYLKDYPDLMEDFRQLLLTARAEEREGISEKIKVATMFGAVDERIRIKGIIKDYRTADLTDEELDFLKDKLITSIEEGK